MRFMCSVSYGQNELETWILNYYADSEKSARDVVQERAYRIARVNLLIETRQLIILDEKEWESEKNKKAIRLWIKIL